MVIRYKGFAETHALRQMMYGYTLLVPKNLKRAKKKAKQAAKLSNLNGHE